MRLYEIENINNPNICAIAVKQITYKKHKGVTRDTPRMDFESYTKRIKLLREVNRMRLNKKTIQKRLQVKNIKMKMNDRCK